MLSSAGNGGNFVHNDSNGDGKYSTADGQLDIRYSGGKLYGYLNRTLFPFYPGDTGYTNAQIDSKITALANRLKTLEEGGSGDNPKPETFTESGGYYKFPNGLILQWLKSPQCWESYLTVAYPIPFPHNCLSVVGSLSDEPGDIWDMGPNECSYFVTQVDNAHCRVYHDEGLHSVYVMAIGY